jgi:hypothetical protein
MLHTAALEALILFSMAACDSETDNGHSDDNDGPTHFGDLLKISGQQVWEHTGINRIKEAYRKFMGEDCDIFIFTIDGKPVGEGEIKNGKLSFEVSALGQENLMEAERLKYLFAEYDEVAIEPPEVEGNIIIFVKSDTEWLNREGLSGSTSSLSLESVFFIYVNGNCRITGKPADKTWNLSYFSRTENPINLSLIKGWNTLSRKEKLLKEGLSEAGPDYVSMGIKNPNDFKWTISKAPSQ